MMTKFNLSLLTIAVAMALAGFSTVRPLGETNIREEATVSEAINKSFAKVPAPAQPPVTVALYGFKDMTGQRKPSNTLSLFSTAVTQGAEAYLIKSLQEVGNRQWFTVVERVGLDNLLKERQMIKQTREIYDGANAKMLPPLQMAGVILEGGIIDYNSNTLTGGTGARIFGIGAQTAYTQDVVVISLRLVSVQTGEVLTTVTVEKNLLSTADGATALKFFNQATQAFEFDSSQTFNEPGNYALRSAIETGVIELIRKGETQGLWKYKEKSNELVQPQAPKAPATSPAPTAPAPQSDVGQSAGGNKAESKALEIKQEPKPEVKEEKVDAKPVSQVVPTDSKPGESLQAQAAARDITVGSKITLTAPVKLRASPGVDNLVTSILPTGTKLTIVDKSKGGNWLAVAEEGQPAWGWVPKKAFENNYKG
jgi:curli production assembly/transport component CsgG